MSPRARWLARISLGLGGIAIGLLAAEGVARLVVPPVGGDFLLPIASLGTPEGMYRAHPRLRSEPTPGFQGVVRTVGHAVPVRFNSVGCRGPEPAAAPHRWIAVGDSFTVALQVTEEHSFPTLLGEALGHQVLNCGVDGYSTWQALERYRIVDDSAQGDRVLLTFFLGNDLADNARAAAQRSEREPPPPPPEPPKPSALERWLITHSWLYGYGQLAVARLALRAPDASERQRLAEELGIFATEGQQGLQRHLGETRRALGALRDEALARGDGLLVAVAPPVFAVDPERAEPTLAMVGLEGADTDAPRRALLALLAEEGIPACDLGPALAEALAQGEHPYLLLDGHWSEAGHRAVASALELCATESGLAP